MYNNMINIYHKKGKALLLSRSVSKGICDTIME